jgi:hypothetical protein
VAQLILFVFNSNQLKYERVNDQESLPLLLFLHLVYLSTLLPCTVLYIHRFLTSLKIVKTYRRASVNIYLYIVHTHVCEAYGHKHGGEKW